MLCEFCGERTATVFVTQVVNEDMTQLRLCESCALQRTEDLGDTPIEDVVRGLFDELNKSRDNMDISDNEHSGSGALYVSGAFSISPNGNPFGEREFSSDEDMADAFDEMEEEMDDLDNEDDLFDDIPDEMAEELAEADHAANDVFAAGDSILDSEVFDPASPLEGLGLPGEPRERREITARRCPKCSITWDRLRQDGRAGCSQCYEAFADQLHEVMKRVQHAPAHHGKKPRAAEKRRNRLEHLRARRDHRLEMLNRRLEEAVRAEKYEEAAKLRDQIKMVASTIVRDDI